jgi:ATP/maltotriose-dependent transcriptional regulator MalT
MSELGRLVPELGSSAGLEVSAFDRPEWIQGRIFEGLLALLRSLGDRAPVLLVLEDLHWADGSTRDVITFLARNARTERLALVGTYRTDELHRRHPLRPWLSEMERLPRVERVDLARFGRTDLAAQVAAILEHAPTPGLLDAVERRAEGNPFFVEELLASGAGDAGEGIPETLRDVLLSRVTALSEDAQRVLGVASVAGRSVASELLAEVAEETEAAIEAPLREAVASQIVVTDVASQGHAYRFRHALLAEAVYDDLLPSERRRLHAAYAEALEARPDPDGAEGASHLAALAHHATEAHQPARALRAWVAAARSSSGAYGFAESLTAYERAISLWDAVPADDRPQNVDPAALYDEASLAAMISGRSDRAVDFARMATALMDGTREPERWAAANVRLSRALWVSGSMQDGLAILTETAAALEGLPPSPIRARVAAAVAGAHMLRGEHSQAIEAAHGAIELARTSGSAVSEAHALATLGTSTVLTGHSEEGLQIIREAFERTKALETAYDDMGRSYANLTSALLIAGRPEESLARAVEGVAWAKSVGAWRGYGRFVTGNAMDAAVALGRWDEADAWLDELLAHDAVGVNRMGMIAAGGTFLAQRGRLELASGLLTEGRHLVEPLQEAQFTAPVYVGLVELALIQGRIDEASEVAAEGIGRLLRTEDCHYLSDLLVAGARAEADLAETLRARRDAPSADVAAGRAATYADRLQEMAHATGGPAAFGGQLEADVAIGRAEAARAAGSGIPDLWAAASSRARRAGPWMEAYTLYRYGEALLAAHAPRQEAEAALATGHAIAQGLSAQPLIGWIQQTARRARVSLLVEAPSAEAPAPRTDNPAHDVDLGLTSREREVLALVAEGYTNRRIAETLFISESTAGVHVSNILGKLGVATRTEAATTATRLGLTQTEVAAEG